jgi:hypothetical protein
MSNSSSEGAVSIYVHRHSIQPSRINKAIPGPFRWPWTNWTETASSLGPVDGSNSDEHRGQARDWNEWGTRICLQHPGRFGLFATLPLLDPDLALSEIAHAYTRRQLFYQ